MKNRSDRLSQLFLAALFMIFSLSAMQASAQKANGVVLQTRGSQHVVNGVNQKYVLVEDLGQFFGFPAQSLENGKSAKIGHLYYNKSVIAHGGKAYVEAPTFFRFFDMSFHQLNNWTFKMNATSNPMFDRTFQRYYQTANIVIDNRPVTGEAMKILNRVYIKVDDLDNILGARKTLDANGKLSYNNKPVDRWLPYSGGTFAMVDDLKQATGKNITVNL